MSCISSSHCVAALASPRWRETDRHPSGSPKPSCPGDGLAAGEGACPSPPRSSWQAPIPCEWSPGQGFGGFRTEAEAKAARDQARVSARSGQYVDRNLITVGGYLDQWLAAHALEVK